MLGLDSPPPPNVRRCCMLSAEEEIEDLKEEFQQRMGELDREIDELKVDCRLLCRLLLFSVAFGYFSSVQQCGICVPCRAQDDKLKLQDQLQRATTGGSHSEAKASDLQATIDRLRCAIFRLSVCRQSLQFAVSYCFSYKACQQAGRTIGHPPSHGTPSNDDKRQPSRFRFFFVRRSSNAPP